MQDKHILTPRGLSYVADKRPTNQHSISMLKMPLCSIFSDQWSSASPPQLPSSLINCQAKLCITTLTTQNQTIPSRPNILNSSVEEFAFLVSERKVLLQQPKKTPWSIPSPQPNQKRTEQKISVFLFSSLLY